MFSNKYLKNFPWFSKNYKRTARIIISTHGMVNIFQASRSKKFNEMKKKFYLVSFFMLNTKDYSFKSKDYNQLPSVGLFSNSCWFMFCLLGQTRVNCCVLYCIFVNTKINPLTIEPNTSSRLHWQLIKLLQISFLSYHLYKIPLQGCSLRIKAQKSLNYKTSFLNFTPFLSFLLPHPISTSVSFVLKILIKFYA